MSEETFVVTTSYGIYYETSEPVPIEDIILSLSSIEALLKRTPKFIEAAYSGIRITDVEVYVDSLQSGSLIEKFMIKYVCKGQENYDQAKQVLENIMDDNSTIRTVVAMGVGGLLTYGAMTAMGKSSPSSHIEAYNNTIVNIGGSVDLKAEDISAVLDSIKDKKTLAKEVVGAIAPARSDPNAKIHFSDIDELTMDEQVIREIPEEYNAPLPDEKTVKYSDTPIVIYASDRDKSDTAWAGIAPGIVDKRVRFKLSDDVSPAHLHGRIRVRADIEVTSKFNKAKKAYEPKIVEILRVGK